MKSMSKQVKSTLVKNFAALALAFACVAVAQTFANDVRSGAAHDWRSGHFPRSPVALAGGGRPLHGTRRQRGAAAPRLLRKTMDETATLISQAMVLDRFTPEERMNIGVHTCPGGDRDSVHSADVPYNNLLPSMF